MRKLREAQRAAERSAALSLRRHRSALGPSMADDLEAGEQVLRDARTAELEALKEGLRKVQAAVVQFTSLLGSVAPSPQYVAKVKAAMGQVRLVPGRGGPPQ